MDYMKKIEESIKFTWKYKALWLFGFIISFFGGGFNSNFNSNFDSENEKYNEASGEIENLFENGVFLAIFCGIVLIGIVIALVGWYLSSVSRAALINAVRMDQKGEEPTFKNGWAYGKTKVWEFIKLDVIAFLLGLVVVLFMAPFIIIGIILPPLLCLLCLAIPIMITGMIIWAMVFTTAQRYIVLKDLSAMESLKAGWKLAKTQVLEYVVAWLVSLLPGCAWTLILMPVGILAVVAMMVVFLGVLATSPVIGLVLLGIIVIAFSLLGSALNSPYLVFSHTYWTKIIMELMEREKKK